MRIRRADANQKAVIAALRSVGATVVSLHAVGGGVPDLLVGYRGETYLLELKGSKSASSSKTGGGKKTIPRQEAWRAAWRGRAVRILEDEDDLAAFYRAIKAIPSSS